jgi:hypothetical protein
MFKVPSSKFQTPEKLQWPSSKSVARLRLDIETWCFSGAWGLGFGVLFLFIEFR